MRNPIKNLILCFLLIVIIFPSRSADDGTTAIQPEIKNPPAEQPNPPTEENGTVQPPSPPADNPEDPNDVAQESNEPALPELSLETQPNDPDLTEPQQTRKYWQYYYHSQVTSRVFVLLNYPYYPGGVEFSPRSFKFDQPESSGSSDSPVETSTSEPDETSLQTPNSVAANDPTTTSSTAPANNQEHAGDSTTAKDQEKSTSANKDETDTSAPSEASADPNTPAKPDLHRYHYQLRKVTDLVYQWRQLNESPGVALEIVRSVELTKTATQIYRIRPELAIQVKRIIGQIGITNGRFNSTQKNIFNQFVTRQADSVVISKLEKQLADLQTLFGNLADQNDQIGVALGLGKFDRRHPYHDYNDLLDYSSLVPAVAAPTNITSRY